MTPFVRPDRRCPKCDSDQYMFRGRRQVDGEAGPTVETKYRCRSCEKDWRERIPAPEGLRLDTTTVSTEEQAALAGCGKTCR